MDVGLYVIFGIVLLILAGAGIGAIIFARKDFKEQKRHNEWEERFKERRAKYFQCNSPEEKQLKALAIIVAKNVDVKVLKECLEEYTKPLDKYNEFCTVLTQDEFDLIKEVLENENH